MLSICIPIFNQDVRPLVRALAEQVRQTLPVAEILLLDDGSKEEFRKINRQLASEALVRYEELGQNVGRSRIRNLLAAKARYDRLLFLDCDVLLLSGTFLRRYQDLWQDSPVLVGGHLYGPPPSREPYHLHWLVGSRREEKDAERRNARPYHSFMTSNFLLHKDVFDGLRFREDLHGYGHEDTLFGFELKKKGIKITHMDNPVLHQGLETAEDFLAKTRESLENLLQTCRLVGNDPEYLQGVTILRTYGRLRSLGLCGPLRHLFRVRRKAMEGSLCGPKPSLRLFDLYKLAYLCHVAGRP